MSVFALRTCVSSKKVQDFSVEVFRFFFIWQVPAVWNDAQECSLQMPVHRQGLLKVEEVVSITIDDEHRALHVREYWS